MKLILNLGDVKKEYDIGESEDAAKAIASYNTYLASGEHADVVQAYHHLFAVIGTKETSAAIIAGIREGMVLTARYMLAHNNNAEQVFWFANQASEAYTRFNIFPTQDIMNLQGYAAAKMQQAGVGPFAPGVIQAFLQNRDNWVELAPMSPEVVDDFTLPANKQKKLSAYTKKFFDKRHEAVPKGGDEGWKQFPKNLINIEEMKNDAVSVIKLGVTKDALAADFAKKLETHGFWAKVLPKTNTGIFVTANLTRSTGMKKSK